MPTHGELSAHRSSGLPRHLRVPRHWCGGSPQHFGWLYLPSERTVHTRPMPAIGGLRHVRRVHRGVRVSRLLDTFDQLFARNSEPRGILLAASIMLPSGCSTTSRATSAPAKVTATVLAGIALVHFGVTMFYFRIPFVDQSPLLSDDWMPLITVLWLLGITQAINLIDGLDGLAAGIVAIAARRVLPLQPQARPTLDLPDRSPTSARSWPSSPSGCASGFLPHNFNPARIFMGDSGALLLGLLLAVSHERRRRARRREPGVRRPDVLLPRPARHPAVDPRRADPRHAFAIVRRAGRRQGVATADKGHLHHRLMNLGHGHRRSVLILWAWTALLSAFVLYPVLTGDNPSVPAVRHGRHRHRPVHRTCTRSVRQRRRDNGEK